MSLGVVQSDLNCGCPVLAIELLLMRELVAELLLIRSIGFFSALVGNLACTGN